MDAHLLFAWTWIVIGLLTGVWLGAFFTREDWLGGYASWPRRLVRLGHVSFVGTGLLNLGAHWTLAHLMVAEPVPTWIRGAFVAGAVAMPAVCFAAAFAKPARALFAVPIALLAGAASSLALAVVAAAGA
jgi:hypothetical protein